MVSRLARSRSIFASAVMIVAAACSSAGNPPPTATSGAIPSSASPAGGSGTAPSGDWLTYHADVSRSGVATGPSMTDVQHAWTSPELDGDVYAEPLAFDGLVIAATENDSVYALDAATGDVVWRSQLGTPVDSSTLPCGNISPTSGITATPVIDASSGLIYAVAFLAPGHHDLFAIHARSGEVEWQRPVDPPGLDPLTQQVRSALTLANGRVYVSFGGLFGDCGEYHGWVAGLAADGSGPMLDYRVPTQNAGGIWAPSGPAVDDDGNLYVATGNSFSSSAFDLGDSVVELSPELEQVGFFAPENWSELNAGDVDLGSVGPAVLDGDLVFQIGKGGVGYLLDGSSLGGIGGEVFSGEVCGGSFGGTAHTSRNIYVPCTDGVAALTIADDARSFSERWRSEGFDAGPPIVAGGLVWTVDLSSNALVGLDRVDGHEAVRRALGEASHFASPSAASGCLFVPTARTITAFCASGT